MYFRSNTCLDEWYKKKVIFSFLSAIGCTIGMLRMLLLVIEGLWLYKFVERIREINLKKKLIKRNGMLWLQGVVIQ